MDRLYRSGHPCAALVVSEAWKLVSGIEIIPGAKIADGVWFVHGQGIVIGEYAVVGKGTRILQQVTLGGARRDDLAMPVVGEEVYIYAGAKLVGGITVGDHASIGANSVVTRDVPGARSSAASPRRSSAGTTATVPDSKGKPTRGAPREPPDQPRAACGRILVVAGALALCGAACSSSGSTGSPAVQTTAPPTTARPSRSGGGGVEPDRWEGPDPRLDRQHSRPGEVGLRAGGVRGRRHRGRLLHEGRLPGGRQDRTHPDHVSPYKTRIVVRRPTDPADFNGTVVVEWLNVSGGLDAAPTTTYAGRELVRSGYAWVGVSAQKIGVEGGPVAVAPVSEAGGGGRAQGAGPGALRRPAPPRRRLLLRHLHPGRPGAAQPRRASTRSAAERPTRPRRWASRSRPSPSPPTSTACSRSPTRSTASSSTAAAAPGAAARHAGEGHRLSISVGGNRSRSAPTATCPCSSSRPRPTCSASSATTPPARQRLVPPLGGGRHRPRRQFQLGPAADLLDCAARQRRSPAFVLRGRPAGPRTWMRTGSAPARAPASSSPTADLRRDANGIVLGGIRTRRSTCPSTCSPASPGTTRR